MRCDRIGVGSQVMAMVSIPAGFSDALRLCEWTARGLDWQFQSLLGFLMRCDFIGSWRITVPFTLVSIPAGFSDALRLFQSLVYFLQIVVSIPAGFSDALRPHPIVVFAVLI